MASDAEIVAYALDFALTVFFSGIVIARGLTYDKWEIIKTFIVCIASMVSWWILSALHILMFADSGLFILAFPFMVFGFVFMFLGLGLLFYTLASIHRTKTENEMWQM